MADLEFSRKEIESLATKLAQIQDQLTPDEQGLLLAIFAAAADSTQPAEPDRLARIRAAHIRTWHQENSAGDEETQDSLREQLLNAYTPGNDFEIVTSLDKAPVLKPIGTIPKSPAYPPKPVGIPIKPPPSYPPDPSDDE